MDGRDSVLSQHGRDEQEAARRLGSCARTTTTDGCWLLGHACARPVVAFLSLAAPLVLAVVVGGAVLADRTYPRFEFGLLIHESLEIVQRNNPPSPPMY